MLGAIRTRFAKSAMRGISWWRAAKRDPERYTNRVILVVSAALLVMSIAAFLWLGGVLEWRGSNGRTSLNLAFGCPSTAVATEPSEAEKQRLDACEAGIGQTSRIKLVLDLAPRDHAKDRLSLELGAGSVERGVVPTLNAETQLQVIANRDFIAPTGVNVTRQESAWFSSAIRPAPSMELGFPHGAILRYTGLSEREFVLGLDLTRGAGVLRGDRSVQLMFVPPEGFEVVETSPPAERASSGRFWTMQLASDDGTFLFRVRLRDFEAGRLDHIIDSSIAAVLGVAVGGIINAYLMLALLRRRRQDGPGARRPAA